MYFCYVTNLNELTSGKYNIPEPTNENIVTDFDNAICIVPGICYDKKNYRIAFSFKKNHVFIFYISPNVQKIVFDKEVNKKIK